MLTRPLIQGAAFEPELIAAMSEALEAACKELQDGGRPEVVREAIAIRACPSVAGDIRQTMATLPELRARAPRHHGREKYSAYTTTIPAFGSASLFIKQGTANVSLFTDGRCCRSVPRLDSRGRFFDGSPACRRAVRHEVTGFRRWRLAQCVTAASRAPTWPLSGQ
jgi:hypothetical protein